MSKKVLVILSVFLMTILIVGCSGSSSTSKKAAEWVGNWYSVKKDSKVDIVSNILVLNITDEKKAHFTSWELTGTKFNKNGGDVAKILWKKTEMDLVIERSGSTLEFTAPDAKELGTVLKCKFDKDKKQLEIKDSEQPGVFTMNDIKLEDIKSENIKKYQEYISKQGINAEIEKDMSDSEYMEYITKNMLGM